MKQNSELSMARYIGIGSMIITLAVWTSGTSDPVNVPKLWILGGVSISAALISLRFFRKQIFQEHKIVIILLAFFVLWLFVSTIFSDAPLSQNVFGVYGRNTGLLAQLGFVLLLFSALALKTVASFKSILLCFLIAGLVNVVYCAWVIGFGDVIGWDNIYGDILGTFGNPNFISAFLGMYLVAGLSVVLSKMFHKSFRIALLASLPVAAFEILESNAVQGLVVALGGVAVVGFWRVKSLFEQKWIWVSYLLVFSAGALTSIFGVLQKGPFSFIYQRSVSLRGSYWSAGVDMGLNNPIFGLGLDTYGDWYRFSRPPQALIDTPDITVVTNVAHNVYIDMFASGGAPLLIAYVLLNFYVFFSIIRHGFKTISFDPLFVAISTTWICYQVQSIVSINQIGLTIWGWILGGISLAYIKSMEHGWLYAQTDTKVKSKNHASIVSPSLTGAIGLGIGLALYFPVLNSDLIWGRAIRSQSLVDYEAALKPSFGNPINTSRLNIAVQTFASSNLPDLALKYAKIGVEFNPNNYDGWRQIYFISVSTEIDKEIALQNLMRLDPNNPNVLDLK
jgi:O-antigen ligase